MKPNNLQKKDDSTLVLLLQAGNLRAFDVIYNRFWERLYVAANRLLEDEGVSKDIIQDIFIDLWNRRASVQINNLNAFLYKAVKFQIAKQLRNRPINHIHLQLISELKSSYRTEDALLFSELNEQIEQVVSTLPPRCQEIFRLSRFEHLSNKEIAHRLGISVSTVENQINIALKTLRSNLDYALTLFLSYAWLNNELCVGQFPDIMC